MTTRITTALLLGFFLLGAAPAAQADRDDWKRRDGRFQRFDRPVPHTPARWEVREVRVLASQLERATDELLQRARHVSRRMDHRRETHAVRALYRLEQAADELRREVARGRVFDRAAHQDLMRAERSFRIASHQLRGLTRDRALRHDLTRVDRLLEELAESFQDHRGFPGRGHGYRQRVAWR